MSSVSRSASDDGLTGAYSGSNDHLRTTIIVLAALAFSHVIELLTVILVTFKRYRGLYFWSLIIATFSIFPYTLGFLFKFLEITNLRYLSLTLITVGWYGMVTGQSVVLYSRLHLVLWKAETLRRLRYMIIANAIIFHLTTTVFTFGTNIPPHESQFVVGFKIIEKVQMTAFCIQEILLSAIYLRQTKRLLSQIQYVRKRSTIVQLGWLNVIIIIMDLGLLGMEYANLYILEATVKPVIYGIKLKLEFVVLNELMQAVRREPGSMALSSGDHASSAAAPRFPERHDNDLIPLSTNSAGRASRTEKGSITIAAHDDDEISCGMRRTV